jgi:PHD/YefM family antitoxin component YafN of YafNO toxin-antitoxin module
MAVHLSVKEISIIEASEAVIPGRNRASIKIIAISSRGREIEFVLPVEDYESVDDALENARLQLLQYAEDLKEAASKTLGGTRRNQPPIPRR